MSTVKVDVQNLHFEHRLWTNELSFFEDELVIFEKRLSELVQKYTDRDMLSQLEHFQNQFIRQKEVLDELKHDIKVHDQAIGRMMKADKAANNDDVDRHVQMGDKMQTYRNIYGDLKEQFYDFLAKWM